MRRVVLFFSLIGLLTTAKVAFADQGELKTLMQRNNCLACHMIDKRKYGPHMMEVSIKYGNDTETVQMLAAKIQSGGAGVWGADMMPPQAHVTDENALLMSQLILALDEK